MINDEVDEIMKELFESLKKRYQTMLEESMKGSECVHLLHYVIKYTQMVVGHI